MADIFLYPGEPNPNDIKLRDPTTPSSGGGVSVLTGLGTLIFTGFAVALNLAVAADRGDLTYSGQAPSLNFTINTATGQLVDDGFSPTVIASNAVTIFPGVGVVVLTGSPPTLNLSVPIGQGTVQLSGFSPGIGYGILSGQGSILVNGFSPIVTTSILIFPPLGTVSLTGSSPTVTATANQQVAPDTGLVEFIGYLPVVDGGTPPSLPPPTAPSDNWSMGSDSRRAIPVQGSYKKFSDKEEAILARIRREDEEILAIIKCIMQCLS